MAARAARLSPVRRRILLVLGVLAAAFVVLQRCTALPSLANRTPSTAIADSADTRLGRAITPLAAAHAGLSGIYPLRDARDAFAARVLLAGVADRTLDVQYYIWRGDLSGTLLLDALQAAADRGVRVRLLLDDNNTSGLDAALAALDAHRNVEVRMFNPFVVRKVRALGYLADFSRVNRRMHNKSFTADGQVTIVGGRNVGDEYFGATDGVLFTDVDVLAVGPVVREVSTQFDRYWASDSAYPLERLVPPSGPDAAAEQAANAAHVRNDPAAAAYVKALRESAFFRDFVDRRLPLEWAAAHTISDDPGKALGQAAPEDLLPQKMKAIFGAPRSAVDLISPYFVPADAGEALFAGWARRGVRLRVLTNALEATDVAAVHAGYARRRKALLAAGATLYELRRAAGAAPSHPGGPLGSSGSSLHAKTFAVDRARVFVGSFNFDPRSAELNTEMGFVIDSPALAHLIEEAFATSIPRNAYEVRLAPDGNLYWLERRGSTVIRYDHEPGTTWWQRTTVWLFAQLPIEWLL